MKGNWPILAILAAAVVAVALLLLALPDGAVPIAPPLATEGDAPPRPDPEEPPPRPECPPGPGPSAPPAGPSEPGEAWTRITGRVVDDTGEPVPGVRVVLGGRPDSPHGRREGPCGRGAPLRASADPGGPGRVRARRSGVGGGLRPPRRRVERGARALRGLSAEEVLAGGTRPFLPARAAARFPFRERKSARIGLALEDLPLEEALEWISAVSGTDVRLRPGTEVEPGRRVTLCHEDLALGDFVKMLAIFNNLALDEETGELRREK